MAIRIMYGPLHDHIYIFHTQYSFNTLSGLRGNIVVDDTQTYNKNEHTYYILLITDVIDQYNGITFSWESKFKGRSPYILVIGITRESRSYPVFNVLFETFTGFRLFRVWYFIVYIYIFTYVKVFVSVIFRGVS